MRSQAERSQGSTDLDSFVPSWIRRRLADDPAPLHPGERLTLDGAVLFADVSGFTPLADRLAQQGAVGAEELSRLLNDYFGQLLALVDGHGGEAFKFAGDALMALWPAVDGDFATATQRATACALDIQAKLHHYEADQGNILALRVAVAQGTLGGVVLQVGERRFGVVVGPPLSEIARALSRARPGDAVLSPGAWSSILARASAATAGTGHWRVTQVDAPPPLPRWPRAAPALQVQPALQGFVHAAASARLAAGHGDWLGELRPLTVLFALVGGLDPVASAAPAQLQAVMTLADPIVQRCQGQLHEIVVDDKGVVLVLVFGLPPAGHEGGASHGVRAALDLSAALSGAGFDSAFGVTTGLCFCGVVGSGVRREYAVVGDTMNVASRLMDSASRSAVQPRVLCDFPTVHAAQARVEFTPLADLSLKGKSEPVQAARPMRLRDHLLQVHAGLVGRAAERQVIAEALERAFSRVGAGCLLLVGEAGMGKSRLVQDLTERARLRGVSPWQGGADVIEAETPYYPWRRVFADMLGLVARADLDTRRAALLRALGPAWADRAALLEPLFALGLADTPATAELSGQPRAKAARDLMIDLLARQAAAGPVVLLLEDAHWFDSASWALACEVSRRLPGLLLVLTLRPLAEPRPAEWSALAESALSQVLTLNPLAADEVLGLVCQRLGVATIPPQVSALIASLAAGLPLFAEELASALLDSGVLQIHAGECSMVPGVDLQELVLPDTVQGVVSGRLDRLPPREALAIKVCSVIGMAFSAQLLRDVHPVRDDAAVLERVMHRLNDAGLTVLEAPEPAPVYSFKHVVTREVAYNLMLFAQRRQLHQAVAQWYEAQYSEERPDLLALLAHHWARAGVVSKAVVYLERSAMRTFSMGLGRAAVDQGLTAARLLGVQLPTDPSAIAPLLGAELARIHALLDGRPPSALLAHRALDDAPAGSVIDLLLRVMPFAHQSAQGELFALMALRCMSLTLLHGHAPGAPVVYAMHSIVYRALTGDAVTAHGFSELALELDRRQGRQLLGPVSFISTWFNQHWVGPVSRALPMSREAAQVAFAAGDVLYGCFNLSAHVVQMAVSGQPLAAVMTVARRYFRRNAQRVRNAAFHCLQELQLAKALAGLTRSNTSLSDDEFDEQRDVRSICDTDHYNQIGYYFIGRLRLLLLYREPSRALDAADQAQALLGAFAGQVGEFELVFFHALALLARARELPCGQAAPLLERADALHAQLLRWSALCHANFGHKALLVQAERARTAGALDPALYQQAARSAAEAGFVQHEALAHELHAEALRAAGQPGLADAVARARSAYGRWGAAAKLSDLSERFG